MKALVQSGRETSHTKSSSHAEYKSLIKNGTLRSLFSFYWPILLYNFDRKSRENVQKTPFKGSSYKMPKVETIFQLIYTLSIVIQK